MHRSQEKQVHLPVRHAGSAQGAGAPLDGKRVRLRRAARENDGARLHAGQARDARARRLKHFPRRRAFGVRGGRVAIGDKGLRERALRARAYRRRRGPVEVCAFAPEKMVFHRHATRTLH